MCDALFSRFLVEKCKTAAYYCYSQPDILKQGTGCISSEGLPKMISRKLIKKIEKYVAQNVINKGTFKIRKQLS